ncbi:DinB family protein [uncultured Kordia sp.]|uniref:DinB family protein n=1 Tax=uncultured Kordia sp. TaxID=507699 RepID=UPI00261927E0|nr:DinB family protein [uncultured Kordia sp.]
MNFTRTVTQNNRNVIKRLLKETSLEALNKIPEGFSNNIIWNIAHIVVIQQLLVYKLSGLPMYISDEMVSKYRNKSKPEGNVTQEEVDEVYGLLDSLLAKTEEDLAAGIFKNYTEYTLNLGTTLRNVEEAIEFNNIHEGIHYGYILALKKAL